MRKLLLIGLLLVVLVVHPRPIKGDAVLLPSRGGVSAYQPLKSSIPLAIKATVDAWLLYDGGGIPGYYLGAIDDADTFMVWFNPPAKCSLIMGELCYTQIAGEYDEKKPITMFMAKLVQPPAIDYVNDYDEYHGTGDTPGPEPIDSILEVKVDSVDTIHPDPDSVLWTYDTLELSNSYDNGMDYFGFGFVKTLGDSAPHPYIFAGGNPPYHTLINRSDYEPPEDPKGWYSSWHFIKASVLVRYYENPPPNVSSEILPYTYSTDARDVYVYANDFGVPDDSSGVAAVALWYTVNSSGTWDTLYTTTPVFGDSTEGIWMLSIPGANVGDTVTYYVTAVDYQLDTAQVQGPYSYVILSGSSGRFLFVNNDYIGYQMFYMFGDTLDYWDIGSYGQPDSSVIAFYGTGAGKNVIVWRDWGCTAMSGWDWGAGVAHADSIYMKQFLDAGGYFWLSDMDLGWGLYPDIVDSVGWTVTFDVPTGSWGRTYLGIRSMHDDDTLLLTAETTSVWGDPTDPVVGPLFDGVGDQTPGFLCLGPYRNLTKSNFNFVAVFDQLTATGPVADMYSSLLSLPVSFRYENATNNSKVYISGYPFDYIVNPATFNDTTYADIDTLAVDSLLICVLQDWWGIPSGASEGGYVPADVFRMSLSNNVITDKVILRVSLPTSGYVRVNLVDLAGRTVATLYQGKAKEGVNPFFISSADAPAPGTYFVTVSVDGAMKGKEKVVFLK